MIRRSERLDGTIDEQERARLTRRLERLRQEVAELEERLGEEQDGLGERDRRLQILEILERSSPDLVTIVKMSGEILYASRNVGRVLGYEMEEFVGSNALDYVHDADTTVIEIGVAHDDNTSPFQYRLRRADGEWLWVESRASTNGKDEPSQDSVWITRDITDRVRLEKHLNRQKVLHDAVTLVAPIALVALDEAGAVVTCLGALLPDGAATFRQIRLDCRGCARGAVEAIEGNDADVAFDWNGDTYEARFRSLEDDSKIAAVGVLTSARG